VCRNHQLLIILVGDFEHGPHFYRVLLLIWLRFVPIPVTTRCKTPQAFGAMEGHLSSVRPLLQHDRTPSGGSEGFEMTWLAPAQSEEYGESSTQYSSPSTMWQDESASLVQDTIRRGQKDPFWYHFANLSFSMPSPATSRPSNRFI
jgi:hypothetical protein